MKYLIVVFIIGSIIAGYVYGELKYSSGKWDTYKEVDKVVWDCGIKHFYNPSNKFLLCYIQNDPIEKGQ